MRITIRSTHRPALVTPPGKSKTLIIGGTITHVNGEEWNQPYCAIVPGGVITLEDIDWEYAWAPEHLEHPEDIVTEEYSVAGSRNNRYTVKRIGDEWSCDCPAFQYGKGTYCKHIRGLE